MMRYLLLTITILSTATTLSARTASEIQLALRKLNVVGSALYVAAHPDDENTAMLAWLANERLVRTGYLSVTRGDGGQNLIGNEKSELLGVIRTAELLEARRIDGAEQFFTRAIDFGYSKTPEETLSIWDRKLVLTDVETVMSVFQPDVVITRFPTTGEGGHGQHTASAILAEEAFAKMTSFAPRRLFWNRFSFRPVDPASPELATSLRVDLGAYNELLGRAYTEIAADSRTQHKSQGFGAAERRGSILNYLQQRAGPPATADVLEGIDLTWGRIPGGEAVGTIVQKALDTFDPEKPAAVIPLLFDALDAMQQLVGPANAPRVGPKIAEVEQLIADCAGLSIEATAPVSYVTPGGEIPVAVTIVNRSDFPLRLSAVSGRFATGSGTGDPLPNNQPVRREIKMTIPSHEEISQPFWLVKPPTKGSYTVARHEAWRANNRVALPVDVAIGDDRGRMLIYTTPVVYKWVDRVEGEKSRAVDIVPEVTINPGSGVYVFPDAKPKQIALALRSFGAKTATIRLNVPKGWSSAPAKREVTFEGNGSEAAVRFTITPPAAEASGNLVAEAELPDGRKLSLGVTEIDYPHIPARRVFGDAAARVVRVDVKKRGERVGYVMGSGDDVPGILRQIGYDVTLLTDEDLDRGDFSSYDAVVTGIRAYNTRQRLRLAHERLMDYVENGGTVVVQYNTGDNLAVPVPGPYPFKISRDRVTVEEAPVTFTEPAHPLLTTPNAITNADLAGWIQERGLYFTSEADPRYQTMLETADPGEKPSRGAQLYAKHGKGAFVYTSMAWWRQLPAGVPGAIRMFANLVSAR